MPYTLLETFRKHTVEPNAITDGYDWNASVAALFRLGISMEDTLRYLHSNKPEQDDFRRWLDKKCKDSPVSTTETIEDTLSAENLAFWDQNGYVFIKSVISKENCEAACNAIWQFLNMNPNDSKTWYTTHEEQRGMMVSFSDHETLNTNRFSLRIQKAYEQLYKTPQLYRTIDKVSFNPPETNSYTFLGSRLHWDVSLKTPIPYALQGLLYLSDCGSDDGAFHCVPGFHKEIERWLVELQPGENPREKALQILKPIPITGAAGDFIIWNNTLPHCASPNRGSAPRMVQYLTYLPNGYQQADEWI